MPSDRVTVRVPATTANIGPGFDCLGIALDLHNTVHVSLSDAMRIEVEGEGALFLPVGEKNLVYRAVRAVFRSVGREAPPLHIRSRNLIPLTRGLGSSASAIVGGVVAANELLDRPLTSIELLRLAVEIEGHPDNVAPALLGGCQISVQTDHDVVTSAVPVASGLRLALFIPDDHIPTKHARSVLPRRVSRQDAVFNVSRASLLVNALVTGQWEQLNLATQDRLHQAYRRTLFPAMDSLLHAAREAGAHGAFLSGAGPTIAAFVTDSGDAVCAALERTAKEWDVPGAGRVIDMSLLGAQVVEE